MDDKIFTIKFTEKDYRNLADVVTSGPFDCNKNGLCMYIDVWSKCLGAIIVLNRDYSISVNGTKYIGKKYEMVLSHLKLFFNQKDVNYALILGSAMSNGLNGIGYNGYFFIETPTTKIKLIQHPEQYNYSITKTKQEKEKREQAIRRYQTTIPERYKIPITTRSKTG